MHIIRNDVIKIVFLASINVESVCGGCGYNVAMPLQSANQFSSAAPSTQTIARKMPVAIAS